MLSLHLQAAGCYTLSIVHSQLLSLHLFILPKGILTWNQSGFDRGFFPRRPPSAAAGRRPSRPSPAVRCSHLPPVAASCPPSRICLFAARRGALLSSACRRAAGPALSHPQPPAVADPFGQTLPRLFSRPPVVDAVVAARLGLIPCCLLQLPVRAPFVPAPHLAPPFHSPCFTHLCSAPPVCWCCASALRPPLFYSKDRGFSALLVYCRTEERGVLCPDLLLQGYFSLVLSVIEAGCPSHSFLLLVFCISAAPEVLCGWSVVQHSFILCF